jgi:hypothetical protein
MNQRGLSIQVFVESINCTLNQQREGDDAENGENDEEATVIWN